MIRLIIFAVTMLLLSSICNGQGRISFGASRAQDTSFTIANVKFNAYGGSLDTMLLIVLPNGDVKKAPFNGEALAAGYGLVQAGGAANVDTTIFFKNGGNDFGISTAVLGSTSGSLDIIAANDTRLLIEANSIKVFNVDSFLIHDDGAFRAGHIISDGGVKFSSYPNAGILGTDANGELIDNSDAYLPILNIESFGADTTNDATAAIQAAINYLAGVEETYNAGDVTLDSVAPPRSGVVYVPAKRYKLLRGLVKNVSHPTLGTRYVNSQLYIPLVTRLDTNDRRQLITIKIQGETPPDFMVNYLNPLYWAQSNREPVLHSLISNDGSTFPAVIRAVPDSIEYLSSILVNNLTEWHLENLTVRVHHDTANGGTQLCGVDFYNTMNQTMRNWRVDTDVDNWYSVQPAYNVFGVRSGVWGTGNTMVFEDGVVTGGFKWGSVGYEHSIWRNVVWLVNYIGYESATANYASVLDNCGMFGNKYLIHAGDFKITAAATENKIRGVIRVESNTQGKWYDRDASFDVVDSLNKLVGPIEWYVTTGSPIDTLRVKGGANLQLEYKYSTTTGTAKYRYPNDVRHNLGGNRFDILFNRDEATPAENSGLSLVGNALGVDLYMKDSMNTGFVNIIMENDRASSGTQAISQLGGSAEVQGSVFGGNRRDIWMLASNGTNNRGMQIGPLTSDSLRLGTTGINYAWLLPAGNWQFAPTSTFNIYGRTTTYNVGIGTTTPLSFLSQTMTDRRVINLTDSTFFAGYYAQGSTGAAMTLGHMNATSGQRYFQMFNSAGIVSQFAISDNGGAVNFYLQRANMANGGTHFGGTAAITPSAWVQAAAGTTTMPPIKWTSGTNLTTPQAGASEFNGTSLFFTPSATRLRFVLTDNTIPSNGQIPIGNGTNYTNATLSGGTGVNITNGAGTVTVATTGDVTVTVTSAGTLSPSASGDYVFTGTTSTWTLPLVTGTSGRKMFIKNRGSGTVTINANAGLNEIYSNAAVNTYALTSGSAIILVSDGSFWNVYE